MNDDDRKPGDRTRGERDSAARDFDERLAGALLGIGDAVSAPPSIWVGVQPHLPRSPRRRSAWMLLLCFGAALAVGTLGYVAKDAQSRAPRLPTAVAGAHASERPASPPRPNHVSPLDTAIAPAGLRPAGPEGPRAEAPRVPPDTYRPVERFARRVATAPVTAESAGAAATLHLGTATRTSRARLAPTVVTGTTTRAADTPLRTESLSSRRPVERPARPPLHASLLPLRSLPSRIGASGASPPRLAAGLTATAAPARWRRGLWVGTGLGATRRRSNVAGAPLLDALDIDRSGGFFGSNSPSTQFDSANTNAATAARRRASFLAELAYEARHRGGIAVGLAATWEALGFRTGEAPVATVATLMPTLGYDRPFGRVSPAVRLAAGPRWVRPRGGPLALDATRLELALSAGVGLRLSDGLALRVEGVARERRHYGVIRLRAQL